MHLENITGTPLSMSWETEGKVWKGLQKEVAPHSTPAPLKDAIIIPQLWAQALLWHATMKYHANTIR